MVIPIENLLMKNPTKTDLSCSVFGHNLERVSKSSGLMQCKTCNTKIPIDQSTAFDALPFNNKEIMSTLQQLYLLKNRIYKRQLSA